MRGVLEKFRIPTLLGLAVVLMGMATGVSLVLQNQTLISQASPENDPQNITISNVNSQSVSISWQTTSPTIGFVKFGQLDSSQVTLDDNDLEAPQPRYFHHVSLKNLLPQANYKFQIVSGKFISKEEQLTTAPQALSQNGLNPIIGTVGEGNKPLEEGVVFLKVSGGSILSAPIKNGGNFIIPLTFLRTADLKEVLIPEKDTIFKLAVVALSGKSQVLLRPELLSKPLGPIQIGQDVDLTTVGETKPILPFDLNNDGRINSSDYSIILQNFGKSPKDKRADLNSDGVVDKKDLSLISAEINKSLDK